MRTNPGKEQREEMKTELDIIIDCQNGMQVIPQVAKNQIGICIVEIDGI